ncbi:MAG: DUF1801 domain-containing protein [Nakamurella sp.]
MSEIDDYLAGLEPAERTLLEHVRQLALEVAPDAEDGRSYGMPALKYRKKPLIGFIAAKTHLSVFPFSPAVVEAVADRLDGFDISKGTIRFSVGHPIPDDVVQDVVRHRLGEITGR